MPSENNQPAPNASEMDMPDDFPSGTIIVRKDASDQSNANSTKGLVGRPGFLTLATNKNRRSRASVLGDLFKRPVEDQENQTPQTHRATTSPEHETGRPSSPTSSEPEAPSDTDGTPSPTSYNPATFRLANRRTRATMPRGMTSESPSQSYTNSQPVEPSSNKQGHHLMALFSKPEDDSTNGAMSQGPAYISHNTKTLGYPYAKAQPEHTKGSAAPGEMSSQKDDKKDVPAGSIPGFTIRKHHFNWDDEDEE